MTTLIVSLQQDPPPTQSRIPKLLRRNDQVLKTHSEGALCLSRGRYVGFMELNEQMDRETFKKVTALVIRYLLVNDGSNIELAKKQHAKKNIVVIDFIENRRKPTVVVHQDKFEEINRRKESILPSTLHTILKIKRGAEDCAQNPHKGEFQKITIGETFLLRRMPSSEYNKMVFKTN